MDEGLDPGKVFVEVAGDREPEEPASQESGETDDVGDVYLRGKAIAVEEEPNVCSICLDEFVEADPGVPTTCGHSYHLQCIMQWAQRSRECPLCFRGLSLEVRWGLT